jgi:hypothetical protein
MSARSEAGSSVVDVRRVAPVQHRAAQPMRMRKPRRPATSKVPLVVTSARKSGYDIFFLSSILLAKEDLIRLKGLLIDLCSYSIQNASSCGSNRLSKDLIHRGLSSIKGTSFDNDEVLNGRTRYTFSKDYLF